MPKKNDVFTLEITDVTPEGMGVGRADGYVVFVAGTAPGDVIEAHLLKAEKSYGNAKVAKIIAPSPMRCEPDCPVFPRCGGCLYRHIKYENELEIKKNWV
ncbi:MAG: TRAM domain-containing protein, partial [Clostridia bacterium]|nr:TRAM domain-containing protein [Clostridia bacterium]